MAESKVTRVVRFLEKNLKEKNVHAAKIILFGSHARGKATPESDIDIVIVSEDFRDKDIFERVNLTREAEIQTIRKFMVPLDIVSLTPEELASETSIIAHYARNGKVLFAA